MRDKEKLHRQLFQGKVSDHIGIHKTIELAKVTAEEIDNMFDLDDSFTHNVKTKFLMDLTEGGDSHCGYEGKPHEVIILVAAVLSNNANCEHIVRAALDVMENCPNELKSITEFQNLES